MSSKCPTAGKENEVPKKLGPAPNPDNAKLSPLNLKFDRLQTKDPAAIQGHGDGDVAVAEFGQFIMREAQLEEEYWTVACLRAESHWENRENDRYVESYKRKFAEQEFNAMKRRYNTLLGDKCKCIVTVKREESSMKQTMLNSIVGTMDLSIRHLSGGDAYPVVQTKPPLFCNFDRQSASKYSHIANLCVARSARRQGIATNLLRFAVLSFKAHGAEKVFVHVHANNEPAQALYEKMGFEVVDMMSSRLPSDATYLLCLEVSDNILTSSQNCYSRNQGAEKVFAHVHVNNEPAQALYEKMGFEVVDMMNSRLLARRSRRRLATIKEAIN